MNLEQISRLYDVLTSLRIEPEAHIKELEDKAAHFRHLDESEGARWWLCQRIGEANYYYADWNGRFIDPATKSKPIPEGFPRLSPGVKDREGLRVHLKEIFRLALEEKVPGLYSAMDRAVDDYRDTWDLSVDREAGVNEFREEIIDLCVSYGMPRGTVRPGLR